MKQITFIAALLVAFSMNAQFTDNFEAETADAVTFTNWDSIDQDGDGNFWEVADIAAAGTGAEASPLDGLVADSDSWEGTAFMPDNFLITKDPVAIGTDWSMSFTMGSYQNNGSFIADRLQIYVTETNVVGDILAATPIFDMTVADVTPADNGGENSAADVTVDLASFAGQSLYVTLRHFDTVDENSVLIDNFSMDASLSTGNLSSVIDFNHYFSNDGNTLKLVATSPISSVKIFTILGQEVVAKNLSLTNAELDLSTLSKGVYVAQVSIEGQVETFKIIKR